MWASLAKALLIVVVWLVRNKLDDNQRKDIAHEIDKASLAWTVDDIDDRLRGHYRDDPRDINKWN
uniref:Uncharacterized protein n=1 Tax=viral metagenome TaxID=1070528 RepID=A0A6H1Z9T1_9ZZZZ